MKTIPYTYKLIFKPTGQYYYGVRWAKGCRPSDLWSKYFTSSFHVKKLIKEYGIDSFIAKVTKTFETKEEASEWETNLLKKVNADRNGKMLNKAINMPAWDASGLKVIHHLETYLETFHDENIKLPIGWSYGQSPSHIENNKKSHLLTYSDPNYEPWNKGGGKPTGPCKESRRKAIQEARLNTSKIKCEYCSKETDPGNYKRFHGNNCKHNPNIDPLILTERSIIAKRSMQKQKETGAFSKPKAPVGIFKCPYCEKEGSNYGAMQRHHFNRCKFKES